MKPIKTKTKKRKDNRNSITSKKKKVKKTENFQLVKAPLIPESIVKMGKNPESSISVMEKHFETLYINAALKIKIWKMKMQN
jgi:hypothetical protein